MHNTKKIEEKTKSRGPVCLFACCCDVYDVYDGCGYVA